MSAPDQLAIAEQRIRDQDERIAGLLQERDAQDRRTAELERERDKLRKLDEQAATHVESLICMRSGHFTAEPPYVGWKGIGLALTEDYDDLRAAQARIAELEAAAETQQQTLEEREAEAYQIIGSLSGYMALFEHPDVIRALDWFAYPELREEMGDILPWPRQATAKEWTVPADRIAELGALLEGRDDFIVSCGLWQSFVDGLPAAQHNEELD